jgi:hypothetical protein
VRPSGRRNRDAGRLGGQRLYLLPFDAVPTATEVLRSQWTGLAQRLQSWLSGLGDDEFFWEPVPGCWTVKPETSRPGGWTYDYEWPAPSPAPLTTIAWRLVHIAGDNWIYWEHAVIAILMDEQVHHGAEIAFPYPSPG